METHKRVLGILFIISGAFQIIGMLFISAFIGAIFPLIFSHAEPDVVWIIEWIIPFVRIISITVILLLSIPSIVGGWGVLNQKSWALTLVLVMGCFKLFSFPVGTALGVYAIWVYSEDKKKKD
ncbi:MAG: hypothetical protein ABI729_03665 [Chitinophagales bacterium]